MRNNIMTFNLKVDQWNSEENAWDIRVNRISKVIKEYMPIVIGTQEGLFRMNKDIATLLPDYSWIGEGRDSDTLNDTGEFNAIFYNNKEAELITWGQFWLSKTPNVRGSRDWNSACNRICTWANLKLKNNNKEFIIYNTHLDHESQQAREEGMKLIIQYMKDKYNNRIPYMLMGDLNCYMDNEVFSVIERECSDTFELKNCYKEVEHDIKATFHNFEGGENEKHGIIDYIFTSNEFKVCNLIIDKQEFDGGHPSDHYPVIATMEIN